MLVGWSPRVDVAEFLQIYEGFICSTGELDFFQDNGIVKQGIIAEVSVAGWRGRGCWSLHYREGDTHLVEDCWILVEQHPTRTRDLPLIFSKFMVSTLFSLLPQRIGTGTLPYFRFVNQHVLYRKILSYLDLDQSLKFINSISWFYELVEFLSISSNFRVCPKSFFNFILPGITHLTTAPSFVLNLFQSRSGAAMSRPYTKLKDNELRKNNNIWSNSWGPKRSRPPAGVAGFLGKSWWNAPRIGWIFET